MRKPVGQTLIVHFCGFGPVCICHLAMTLGGPTVQPLALRRRTSSVEYVATPKSSVNTPVGLDGVADVIFPTGTNGQHVRRVTTTERDAALYSMAQVCVPTREVLQGQLLHE